MKLQSECESRHAIGLAVRRALLAATIVVAATQMPDVARAADAEIEEVVVTGSILRRTDTETPSPVAVLTAESLAERGINTVNEALQRLTANGSGTLNNGWNGGGGNFASGGSAPSLRGLTVQATLTVFDGVRMSVYPFADDGHRNFVDLNTIPQSVIDRIEVLKDGASSTFGADAIAGVVNVITKKEITGFHANTSLGKAVATGGGTELHLDGSWGMGQLKSDGYNFYVGGELQKSNPIWAKDLAYPANSENLSHVCDSAGHCLMNNSIWGITNGVDGDGAPFSEITGSTTSYAPIVRPTNAAGLGATGPYRLLNQAAGCNILPGLYPVTPTADQLATLGTSGASFTPGATYCGADRRNLYGQLQGDEHRAGVFSKFTKEIGDNAEFFASAAYYNAKEQSHFPFSNALANQTTVPSQVTLSPVVLPIYVCSAGVGTIVNGVNVSSGCDSTNGTLNPNNPFAAAGSYARLVWRYDGARTADTDGKALRGAMGLTGSFGDGWNYSTDLTYSKAKVELVQAGNPIPQNIATAIAKGTFNFVDPASNSEAARQFLAPDSVTNSHSSLWQAQATLGKKLWDMGGGPLQAAIGASYRHESLLWESANPDNPTAPYTRYYGVNSVGAEGSRNVKSPFFEIDAPFAKQFEVNVSGRYDKYSSGQDNFSPKVGVKFKPVEQLAVRGTFSKGFRIPSFNEAYGLPVTGFSGAKVDCNIYTAFCAAHNSNSYATGNYTLGETTAGNPSLNPEKSTSYTAGIVFAPLENISMTVDYWNIEVKDLIAKLSSADRQTAIDQYYLNNGVVNIPGIVVSKGVPDALFPNALPLLGYVSSSFNNSDKENASGIDASVAVTTDLPGATKWRTEVDASYLSKYNITRKTGDVEKYAGTLSPCDYTSCSGSPRWRANFSNTFSWEKLSVTGTLYFTSRVNLAEVDYGGDPNDCVGSAIAGTGSPTYYNTDIPVMCRSHNIWNFDVNARYKLDDKTTVYLDLLNALNISAPFDPSAAYSNAYFYPQYNTAFATENAIGRFIRIGVRTSF
jgi:iron complex outermembrane receptor protein